MSQFISIKDYLLNKGWSLSEFLLSQKGKGLELYYQCYVPGLGDEEESILVRLPITYSQMIEAYHSGGRLRADVRQYQTDDPKTDEYLFVDLSLETEIFLRKHTIKPESKCRHRNQKEPFLVHNADCSRVKIANQYLFLGVPAARTFKKFIENYNRGNCPLSTDAIAVNGYHSDPLKPLRRRRELTPLIQLIEFLGKGNGWRLKIPLGAEIVEKDI